MTSCSRGSQPGRERLPYRWLGRPVFAARIAAALAFCSSAAHTFRAAHSAAVRGSSGDGGGGGFFANIRSWSLTGRRCSS
jgi:hypothetical protein